MPPFPDPGHRRTFLRRIKAWMHPLVFLGFPLLCLAPSVGIAEITVDGSLGPGGPLTGPNYQIPHDLGRMSGANLFHSFGKFNLTSTESATFSGPDTVANIIGRITGGPSSIDGLINSTIPGANLFLLNPGGILFGPNASLDVKGAFHASTADFLRFSDGGIFHADPAAASVLSVAPPSSFGFLAANPAGISIQQSNLAVPAGKTLSMVGGDVDIAGDSVSIYANLKAPGGQIALVSAASPGEVTLGDFGTPGVASLGNITVRNANLLSESSSIATDPAGTILIRGGKLFFQDSTLYARGNPGGVVDVRGSELRMDDSYINTGTRGAADHPGLAVDLNVSGEVLLTNGAEIASSSYSAGRAGNVRISADSILLGDADATQSRYTATGYYGDIGSRAFASGRGGDVEITAGALTVRNGFFINTAALKSGDAGNVTVRADALNLLDGGSISSNGFGAGTGGTGGTVDIVAGDVLMSHKNIANVTLGPFTGIAAQADYGSKGGALLLTATNLQILDGAKISTTLYSTGPGADIVINAKNVLVSGMVIDNRKKVPESYASITARVVYPSATGTGGDIRITADSVKVADSGLISSGLFLGATGNAGDITIQTGGLELSNRGTIQASSVDGTGNSGRLDVTAKEIRIVGDRNSTDPFAKGLTGMSTATKDGQGGELRVSADSLLVTDKGAITASSIGSGAGGNITVVSETVSLGAGAVVSATSSASGNAGNIVFQAGTLDVSNNGGILTSSTAGAGNSGSLDITAREIRITGIRDALDPLNNPLEFTGFSSATNAGLGGELRVSADSLLVTDKGAITASSIGSGTGGNITVVSETVSLGAGAVVSAKSSGSGNAGNITIEAAESLESRNGFVTTEAARSDGGNITLKVGSIVHLVDSEITASVGGGPESVGGNISIDPQFVILQNSRIVANAFEGTGGNITISANVFLADPDSVVDASSALGVSGTVDIRAVISNVTGVLGPLPSDTLSASALLRERCIARIREGKYSSFVVGGRDGLPIEPGNLMPSPPL